MTTYQDLLKLGEDEQKRTSFVSGTIGTYEHSDEYKNAVEATAYYDGENPTIMQYEKLLFDMQGKAQADMWSANHKIASPFFGMVVKQEVNYLLSNGVKFQNDDTEERLGDHFHRNLMRAIRESRTTGCAYVYWDGEKTFLFKRRNFIPLYDEENGKLMAGIRFWRLAKDKPLRATLYEVEGYTEYGTDERGQFVVLQNRRGYQRIVTESIGNEITIEDANPYGALPVIPIPNGESQKSELNGKRNTIDALDIATSKMVNNVDEGALIYWVLTNTGGMEDLDMAEFLHQVQTLHAFKVDADAGSNAEPHTIEAPFAGTEATIDTIEERLYKDFQAFNPDSITASNQSATAIRAGYTQLDFKADELETEVVTPFIDELLKLVGIDDKPSYERNRPINKMEETQTVIMQAPYLGEEYTRQKLLTINGDIDMLDMVNNSVAKNEYSIFNQDDDVNA